MSFRSSPRVSYSGSAMQPLKVELTTIGKLQGNLHDIFREYLYPTGKRRVDLLVDPLDLHGAVFKFREDIPSYIEMYDPPSFGFYIKLRPTTGSTGEEDMEIKYRTKDDQSLLTQSIKGAAMRNPCWLLQVQGRNSPYRVSPILSYARLPNNGTLYMAVPTTRDVLYPDPLKEDITFIEHAREIHWTAPEYFRQDLDPKRYPWTFEIGVEEKEDILWNTPFETFLEYMEIYLY